ncbi:unnamed protein product [Pelagomonas calceolata]|uniref:Uncharacterized protein n=1 Tax=Pelagomonas calceolata TaxID=35677 RepID=A0A8J2SVV3_9STRA|nr:unnamed protein product [Pelagomonas calceolata]
MVDYSKFDGIADSDEETTEPIELGTTREAGNALFKQKKYAAAIATYSALLDDADDDEKALLLCNRSACLLAVDNVLQASRDAKQATALKPQSAKAWYRFATAELKRKSYKNARIAAAKAHALDDSAATRALLKKCKAAGAELYGEKVKAPRPSPTHVEAQARDAQLALERLRRMARDAADGKDAALQDAHGMCVYFTKLACNKADFREMIFPGEPPQRFDDNDLPGTLCEFLNDERYASSIKKRWPSVLRKAHTVLVGAKKQGEDAGETMPPEVERVLWPQIVAEAYAREFQECAHEGTTESVVELPSSVEALPRQACRALSLDADADTWGGVGCVVPNYLGKDWHAAVADDVARLIEESQTSTKKTRRLQQLVCDGDEPGSLASRGAVAWLDPTELDADFPALAELAKRLRGLPEAFAQAAASKPDAREVRPLLEPALPIEWEPCAALAPPSKGPQLLVLDPDHVVDNNLFLCDGDGDGARPLISALYFVDGGDPRAHLLDPDPKAKPPETLGGDVVLKRAPDGDFAHVEPRADALVLWRSKLCYHAREPVKKGCRAVVRHWVFAAPDVMERNRDKAAAA